MVKRQKVELLPTMKIKADEGNDLDIPFKQQQVSIVSFKDQDTKHGDKLIITVEGKDGSKFNVFANAKSQNALIDAWGDEDTAWVGKLVELTKEKNEHYGNEMIVLKPIK